MYYSKFLELHEKCPTEILSNIPEELGTQEYYLEACQRVARFATMLQMKPELPVTPSRLVEIAQDHIQEPFTDTILNEWARVTKSPGGLYAGDIELAAQEIDVMEVIWPFDEQKMAVLEQESELQTAA